MTGRSSRVALLVETSNAHARGVLRGVATYMREHGPWVVDLHEQSRGEPPPSWIVGWPGDGILARVENAETARLLQAARLPTVCVSQSPHAAAFVRVLPDDDAVARAAAEHLIERQLHSFAYSGFEEFLWSRLRGDAFERVLAAAGHEVSRFDVSREDMRRQGAQGSQQETMRWLRRLSKPAGVFACHDVRARQVLEACRLAGLAVPDEVAVLGVDDDELLCGLADPGLSSIPLDTHLVGYQAAATLHRLIEGGPPPPTVQLVPPLEVVTRRSTDLLAADDPIVARAARFIRDHACEGITVADVLAAVPASRRVIEARFRGAIGHSLHSQILRVRLDRVRQLLRQTTLSLAEIAARTGFTHVEYLSVVFKKKFGETPSAYRLRWNDVVRRK